MAIQEVIKCEGENSVLIYKHPAEDFNTMSQLIVHESEEAVFFSDGQALDSFRAGRYTLETKNIPLISKLRNLVSGGVSPFHTEVYFINLATMMDIPWGTPSQVTVRDPNYGYSYNEFNQHLSDISESVASQIENGIKNNGVEDGIKALMEFYEKQKDITEKQYEKYRESSIKDYEKYSAMSDEEKKKKKLLKVIPPVIIGVISLIFLHGFFRWVVVIIIIVEVGDSALHSVDFDASFNAREAVEKHCKETGIYNIHEPNNVFIHYSQIRIKKIRKSQAVTIQKLIQSYGIQNVNIRQMSPNEL